MTDTAPDDFPFPTKEQHDAPEPPPKAEIHKEPSEHALDQGVAESFPASDPVSVSVTKIGDDGTEKGSRKSD